MSLLRLLTAGRCWIGAKPMGRYKFSDPRSMPKFGAGPNPFKGKTEEKKGEGRGEKAEEQTEEGRGEKENGGEELMEIAVPQEEEKEGLTAKEGDRADTPEAVPKEEVEGQAGIEGEKVEVASRPHKRPGWISRVGSLTSSLRVKLWKPRQGAPQPLPIQGELSLDNIKPVRNDLSDTDLEVVPLRTSALVKAKAKARNAEAENGAEAHTTAPEQEKPQPQERDLIEAGT